VQRNKERGHGEGRSVDCLSKHQPGSSASPSSAPSRSHRSLCSASSALSRPQKAPVISQPRRHLFHLRYYPRAARKRLHWLACPRPLLHTASLLLSPQLKPPPFEVVRACAKSLCVVFCRSLPSPNTSIPTTSNRHSSRRLAQSQSAQTPLLDSQECHF
jgi:hypothetical protein